MHAGKNDDEIQFPAVAGKKGRTKSISWLGVNSDSIFWHAS